MTDKAITAGDLHKEMTKKECSGKQEAREVTTTCSYRTLQVLNRIQYLDLVMTELFIVRDIKNNLLSYYSLSLL